MNKAVKNGLVIALTLGIAACAGKPSPQVAAMQKKDKFLSCKEILLEINEAEFYRRTAEKNKNPGVSNILMPLGYISTYVNAEEAIKAANARAEYLNRIYEILDCENPNSTSHTASAAYEPAQPYYQPSQAPKVYYPTQPQTGAYQQPNGYYAPQPAAPAPNGKYYHQMGHQPSPTDANDEAILEHISTFWSG